MVQEAYRAQPTPVPQTVEPIESSSSSEEKVYAYDTTLPADEDFQDFEYFCEVDDFVAFASECFAEADEPQPQAPAEYAALTQHSLQRLCAFGIYAEPFS